MFVATPPSLSEILSRLTPDGAAGTLAKLAHAQGDSSVGYPHWDKVRHLEPPDGLSHEEWWLSMKMGRAALYRSLPIPPHDGRTFVYSLPDEALRLLHHVDRHCSGEIAMPEVVTADDQVRERYLVNSLMEEAIRSSQLEGATTSRRAAKEMLRTGRPPADRSERMILNNYRAFSFMRESMNRELTPDLVLALHRILTEDTLDDPDAAGRLQSYAEERVAVYDRVDGSLLHRPPPAAELPRRLVAMCRFANEDPDSGSFMHPVVRAILIHFWLAYDHPFEDGNGRTARALFYWSMRIQGYWLVEYLSISGILRKAFAQYTRSYVETETDEGDTTYFILHQLEVMKKAIAELHDYLRRKMREVREVERLIRGSGELNHRQLALLGHAVRHAGAVYSFQSHAVSHGVTHETARSDLLELRDRGLLERRKVGRRHVFSAAVDLPEALRAGVPRRPGHLGTTP